MALPEASSAGAPAGNRRGAGMTVAVIQKNAREELRVSVETFRGVPIVNLRVWFRNEEGEWRPGKQGVALRLELLPELRQALAEAEVEAGRRGLMPEGSA